MITTNQYAQHELDKYEQAFNSAPEASLPPGIAQPYADIPSEFVAFLVIILFLVLTWRIYIIIGRSARGGMKHITIFLKKAVQTIASLVMCVISKPLVASIATASTYFVVLAFTRWPVVTIPQSNRDTPQFHSDYFGYRHQPVDINTLIGYVMISVAIGGIVFALTAVISELIQKHKHNDTH